MQKTEHSVLLERLAYALEEHTQAPGFAGGLTLNMRRRCYSRGAFSARMAFRLSLIHIYDSLVHEDVMIGAADTVITGKTKDGRTVPLFQHGEWVF